MVNHLPFTALGVVGLMTNQLWNNLCSRTTLKFWTKIKLAICNLYFIVNITRNLNGISQLGLHEVFVLCHAMKHYFS